MPVKVVHVPSIGEVRLIQSSRSRTIKLSVRPGRKILVSFPLRVSSREAVRFATLNAEWIAEQQLKIEKKNASVFRRIRVQDTFSPDPLLQSR